MLEMTAVRSTTGNYYGALRDDASDGTAKTDIPDPLPEGYLHHLPSEVLAIVLHYLTTAARIPFCDAGDRLRLTRMTRRLRDFFLRNKEERLYYRAFFTAWYNLRN